MTRRLPFCGTLMHRNPAHRDARAEPGYRPDAEVLAVFRFTFLLDFAADFFDIRPATWLRFSNAKACARAARSLAQSELI
jgi:hypothetical protein